MSILEDSAVIAKFMGYKPKMLKAENISNPAIRLILGLDNDKNKTVLAVETAEHESLFYQPHKDWNQLMEAVEKIEKQDKEVIIYKNAVEIWDNMQPTGYKIIVDEEADTKIQAVYQAVLEYIKQQKEG